MENELKTVKADKEALQEQLSKVNGTEGGNKLLISVIEAANEYIAIIIAQRQQEKIVI